MAFLSNVRFTIKEGRLGQGPELLAVISFVNRGNRPVILSRLIASYGYIKNEPAPNCERRGGYWTGLPWSEALYEEGRPTQALPRAIMPHVANVTVYSFEPGHLFTDKTADKILRFIVCLEYEAINSEGKVFTTRHPVGTVSLSEEEHIKDIEYFDRYRNAVTIVP